MKSCYKNYHEQVISVVDRAEKLSEAELIIKFKADCIFRDLRYETYISSEEKTSSDGENRKLNALT